MPELPEVETVRRGLSPAMEGKIIERLDVNRPNLRFPFPEGFKTRVEGASITRMGRRAKFLVTDAKLYALASEVGLVTGSLAERRSKPCCVNGNCQRHRIAVSVISLSGRPRF